MTEATLRAVYSKYAQIGKRPTDVSTISLTQWLRLLKDAAVLPRSINGPEEIVSRTDAEMALIRCAGQGKKSLGFDQFCDAIGLVASWRFDQCLREDAVRMFAQELSALAPVPDPTSQQPSTQSPKPPTRELMVGGQLVRKALAAIYKFYAMRGRPLDRVLDCPSFVNFCQEYSLIPQISTAAAVRVFQSHADGHGGTSLSFDGWVQCLLQLCDTLYSDGLNEEQRQQSLLEQLSSSDACLELQSNLQSRGAGQALHSLRRSFTNHLSQDAGSENTASLVGQRPVGGEADQLMTSEQQTILYDAMRRFCDSDGQFSLASLSRFAKQARLMGSPGVELSATDLDTAYSMEVGPVCFPYNFYKCGVLFSGA